MKRKRTKSWEYLLQEENWETDWISREGGLEWHDNKWSQRQEEEEQDLLCSLMLRGNGKNKGWESSSGSQIKSEDDELLHSLDTQLDFLHCPSLLLLLLFFNSFCDKKKKKKSCENENSTRREWNVTRSYLSILMATRFRMEAVLSVTSNAIQKSQIVSLNSQSTLTCEGKEMRDSVWEDALIIMLDNQ